MTAEYITLELSTWSWQSGCLIGLRNGIRGFDAQLRHLPLWMLFTHMKTLSTIT